MGTEPESNIPAGFKLRHTLRGHKGPIGHIAWSPDGRFLASPSVDKTIQIWNAQTGQLLQTLRGHSYAASSVAWSPDGGMLVTGTGDTADPTVRLWDVPKSKILGTLEGHVDATLSVTWSPEGKAVASGSHDKTIRLWDAQTGQHLQTLKGHSEGVNSIAWSLDGKMLASGSNDGTIRLWDVSKGKSIRISEGNSNWVLNVTWSPNRKMLASGSNDGTIRLWDVQSGKQVYTLERHTAGVICLSSSSDGRFLASKSWDNTVRLWRTDTWEEVAVLKEPASDTWTPGIAFHPSLPVLATLGKEDTAIRIWDLDVTTLLKTKPATLSVHYTNAKAVLVGNSGVGKSGLGLVLTGQPFVPTESTHGRHVWNFDSQREVALGDGRRENRETLLWDLAGQPGYRLVHQLYLNEVSLALVVFDSHDETDPFAGVDHWARALKMAQRVHGASSPNMKKFLVAARIDRGGKGVSRERVEEVMRKFGFDGYFETSAKEGWRIDELRDAIRQGIDWDNLPKVTSTELFRRIQAFLVAQKGVGRLLSTGDDLYRAYLAAERDVQETRELPAQFETCIGRVESQGLIRRLSFGNLVLLQPERLDSYASALVNAVRDEPDGLGSIAEVTVRAGRFPVPAEERVADREQERLLLLAMIEDLLRYEIALREQDDLVFPSQSTRENPDLPDVEGKAVIFTFEGPVEHVYATLAVRLSHSGLFQKVGLWKNAVTYTTKMGGTYGLFLRNLGEGRAELTLFFDAAAREETRFHFEEFAKTHLERRALPDTIQRRRIFVCPGCGTPLDDLAVRRRRERGFNSATCIVCETKVSLLDREERLVRTPDSLVSTMDRSADEQRNRATAASILQGKMATGDFDVFLCHNGKDKPKVKEIGEQLKELGILPWLDEWELPPGQPWQSLLERQIGKIKSAAVFVSKNDLGPWQRRELYAFLSEFVNRRCPVIPVLLPGTPETPELPIFLKGMTWVDFRRKDPDPMKHLIWGITGKQDWERGF